MKQQPIVLLTLFFGLLLLVFACRKEIDYYLNDREAVPAQLLEAAKVWHLQHLDPNDTREKLAPKWKQAWTTRSSSGSELVVVPAPERHLQNQEFSIRRFFIFQANGSNIREGRIVEFVGQGYDVNGNFDFLVKHHMDRNIPEFKGSIIEYDVNYNQKQSAIYRNGQRINGHAFNQTLYPGMLEQLAQLGNNNPTKVDLQQNISPAGVPSPQRARTAHTLNRYMSVFRAI